MNRFLLLALTAGLLSPSPAEASKKDFDYWRRYCIVDFHESSIKEEVVMSSTSVERSCDCYGRNAERTQKYPYFLSYCPKVRNVSVEDMKRVFGVWD